MAFSLSVAASASGMMREPGGSSGSAICSTMVSASPRARSDLRPAESETARSCDSRESCGATAISSTLAMVDIGTILPSPAFRKMFCRSVGSLTGLVEESSFTG
ncbi:hypothetical protein D9M70_629690 [compost metagenome]